MSAKLTALISVADKRYVTNLARDLVKYGYEIIATGGTFKKLKEAQLPVKELSRVFKTPEMLGGRVKSLHSHVHAAILADPTSAKHTKELKALKIRTFDVVVVNFYPFNEKVQIGKTPIKSAMELIDIGGPAMVRAAAKNHAHVAVVSSVDQYRELIRQLRDNDGQLSDSYRLRLARDAFRNTAQYESTVSAYFEAVTPADENESGEQHRAASELLPRSFTWKLKREEVLRYGENPHQQAARYSSPSLATIPFKVLQGKVMSFNNYQDAAAALAAISAPYTKPLVACVVKHLNPCGAAVGDNPLKTFIAAREADPKSAFGGVVSLNYDVDEALAKELRRTFFEIIIAPSFSVEALTHLTSKKNLRLVEADPIQAREVLEVSPHFAVTFFGALLQSHDTVMEQWQKLQAVTDIQPPEELRDDILDGLRFIRFMKSNSLCLVKNGVMIGRGVGQMSRVDAAELAIASAGRKAKGAVLISDGFFPFADSIEIAAKAKVACVVAPAGSKRDHEVVAAADKLKLPLIFAPYRHFRH
jgi:phosphoribosylaminoimidazolecarboxamide formyltransferase/IMP cyclohydrolase